MTDRFGSPDLPETLPGRRPTDDELEKSGADQPVIERPEDDPTVEVVPTTVEGGN